MNIIGQGFISVNPLIFNPQKAKAMCYHYIRKHNRGEAGVRENESGAATAAAAKLCQSCPTLCDPAEGSPPGSPVPGILQARTLEWIAISFSI